MDELNLAAQLVGYANRDRYFFRGNFIFQGIPLQGAHVLEVGAGTGAWAIWAGLHGASKVLGIEPEFAGSTKDTLSSFRKSIERLNLDKRIEAQNYCLQDLPQPKTPFDVVVMYNVINHLDEDAVIRLHQDKSAVDKYVAVLQRLRSQMSPTGWLVLADCARDNLWPRFGMTAPLARSIEWEKHQNPNVWIEVLKRAGFGNSDLRWSPFQPLPWCTGNWLVQYLTCSHFVLRLRPQAS